MDDRTELRQVLKGESGREFLQSLPLLEAYIESSAILGILRQSCLSFLPLVERKLGVQIGLAAFGSVGRLEFVPDYSDLDPLIIVSANPNNVPNHDDVRSAVLTPLAKMCPWLHFDDSPDVTTGHWKNISNCDLKYPVYVDTCFLSGDDVRARQRQWQLLLEGRPLYNAPLLNQLVEMTLPKLKSVGDLTSDARIDFGRLIETVPEFYSGFEDPTFLFKDAFKYWKTRFLREFYAFATNLSFVLGWYLHRDGEVVSANVFGGSTALKMLRATRFAQQLEGESKSNSGLRSFYQDKLKHILAKWDLDGGPLLLFGRDYATEPARLLHGLLGAVLSRFATCWEKLYDPHIRSALNGLPKSQLNFDAKFRMKIRDAEVSQVVNELMALRNSYLKYMGATAEAIFEIFPRGRVWSYGTVPYWLGDALNPFMQSSPHAR